MAKVNPNDYRGGQTHPKLVPAVLGGVDVAVLTVMESNMGITTGDGRTTGFLVFAEFPEYAFWLNATGIGQLIGRFGDDDDDWLKQTVPLVKVRVHNPSTGKKVEKFHIADDEEWDEAISAYNRKRQKPQAKAPATGKKKAGKKK